MIERKILIALITQNEFIRQIRSEFKPEFLESATAKILANWCFEFYDKHQRAPMHDIENIYIKKLRRKNIDKELAEEIEQEILPSLSEEYEKGELNVTFLLEEARAYFKERQITIHKEHLESLLNKNKVDEAESAIKDFKLISESPKEEIDLSSTDVLNKLESAFDATYQNVIRFPGALGDFWNDQLVRGGLVALLAPEKRGKTFLLLEFLMKAYRQKRKVVFFQAGDMTENQMLLRLAIYLAKKSNKEKYCGVRYIPIQDCIHNQLDTCDKKVRECNFGIFTDDAQTVKEETKFKDLIELYNEHPRYKSCFNCPEWKTNSWGVPWIKKVEIEKPLSLKEAKRHWQRFFIRTKRKIKVSTHVNGTLTVSKIKSLLQKWKLEEDYVPDVIIIDYADLLEPEKKMEFRHQQNQIWKDLRSLSQIDDCLVITATQADADSYKRGRLGLDNYSEDKRKYAHVTAMYGLNQDVSGREKEIGIMRINKIVVREDDFHQSHEVNVLQRLEIGRPFLGSYL